MIFSYICINNDCQDIKNNERYRNADSMVAMTTTRYLF